MMGFHPVVLLTAPFHRSPRRVVFFRMPISPGPRTEKREQSQK